LCARKVKAPRRTAKWAFPHFDLTARHRMKRYGQRFIVRELFADRNLPFADVGDGVSVKVRASMQILDGSAVINLKASSASSAATNDTVTCGSRLARRLQVLNASAELMVFVFRSAQRFAQLVGPRSIHSAFSRQ
jgi:hypothetical protein